MEISVEVPPPKKLTKVALLYDLLFHSWEYIERNVSLHKIEAPVTHDYSSTVHNSQTMEYESAIRSMKLYHFQENGWNWKSSC
jgi:hypothetical protein